MGNAGTAQADAIQLANGILEVVVDARWPLLRRYRHVASESVFGAADSQTGVLLCNGRPLSAADWEATVESSATWVTYSLSARSVELEMVWRIELEAAQVCLRLTRLHDPQGQCQTLAWRDAPLLRARGADLSYWRLTTTPHDPQAFNKMWTVDQVGSLADGAVEPQPGAVIFGAVWNDRVGVVVDSNYPLFPLLHQVTPDRCYTIAANEYRPRVRQRRLPLLTLRIAFVGDLNQDGRADLSDCRLWLNRSLPDGDPLYREAIWYKIFLCGGGSIGVRTTLPQAEEMIRGIHRATDGLPQVVYLVGQQHGGHDGDYPTLSTLNEDLGSAADHARLAAVCRDELNTVLSYHTNLDDAYRHSRDWDDRWVVAGGAPGEAEFGVHGSVCHTRDAELGDVFRRLEALLAVLPVRATLHFDNLRLTNTVNRPECGGIGVLEELVCGMMPVMEWLQQRGITVTTEGYNGLPIDPRLLVHGFWHHDCPDSARQVFHRKIMGGGRGDHVGRYTTMDWGICNAIHQDFSYDPISRQALGDAAWERDFSWLVAQGDVPLTVSWREDVQGVLDRIYGGVLLHQFYQEQEMLSWEQAGSGVRMRFTGDVVADVCIDGPDTLVVRQGQVLIADGPDRFLPRGDAVYAYSPTGSARQWRLPPSLCGRPLVAFTLSPAGRGPAPEHTWCDDGVWLRLRPHEPVKLMPLTC